VCSTRIKLLDSDSVKKGIFILVFGLVAAAAAYGCIYFACTAPARSLRKSDKPELAWLKEEFSLNDPEFKRVSELHAEYLPQCRDMCREIDAQNVKLQKLLSGATNMTPEINAAASSAHHAAHEDDWNKAQTDVKFAQEKLRNLQSRFKEIPH
jgi:hypothetical protein